LKILFGLICITVLLFSQISIKNAWQRVERENDTLKASYADIKHSKLKQESAKGMYMPSVTVTGSYTHLNDTISLDTSGISSILGSMPIPIPFPSEIDFLDQDIALIDLQVLYPFYNGRQD